MKTFKYIFLIFLLPIMGQSWLQAQNFDFGLEKVHLFTYRTLFISGESLGFEALVENDHDQSKTLYIELILPDGTPLLSQKQAIANKRSSGRLEIPQDILSGVYYIKAYTKYMRNFGAKSFAYLPIKIINPYSTEFLSGNDADIFDSVHYYTVTSIIKNSNPSDTYQIELDPKAWSGFENLFVSVVPAFSVQQAHSISPQYNTPANKYFPETRGLSLSGILVDSISNQPLAFKNITLSIIDQKNFIPRLTDAEGRFYFALPDLNGNHDLFISTKKEDDVHPKILVDKDYDTERISLPNPVFSLSEQERKTALAMAQSLQITQNYYIQSTTNQLDTFLIPFYGHTENVLNLDRYIALETLEEYFTELPGLIRIKNQKKRKFFNIASTVRDMSIYDPLVLMDMVAVEDYDRILAVSPHGIEKVEIVPQPYVYGNFIYGGIISLRSRNGDFGGISLPKTGLFFNYDFYQAKSEYKQLSAIDETPDSRNTLFSKMMSVNPDKAITFEIKKASSTKKYWLVIQGINTQGEIISKIGTLE
ncbi:MAG: hypothetical protein JW857_07780 [Bacteroidales bacterium]|nr:hypothetical protein [Bacteroidales bacterium]